MSWQGLCSVMVAKLAGPSRIWQSVKVEIFMAARTIRVFALARERIERQSRGVAEAIRPG